MDGNAHQSELKACVISEYRRDFQQEGNKHDVETWLPKLFEALNRTLDRNFSHRFWGTYLRYWISNFTDLVLADVHEILNQDCEQAPFTFASSRFRDTPRFTDRMQDLLDISQDLGWRLNLQADIRVLIQSDCTTSIDDFGCLGAPSKLARGGSRSFFKRALASIAVRKEVVLTNTYLPRACESLLCFSLGSVPFRWQEPELSNVSVSGDLRLRLKKELEPLTGYELGSLVLSLVPYYFPLSCLELIPQLEERHVLPSARAVKVIFTANNHFASDTFAFWAAKCADDGARLLISQHGGLNGQGVLATRDEETEQVIADSYLHWGWSDVPNGVKIPSQLTVWKRPRRNGTHGSGVLLVTDATFRFRRKWWSDSPAYKALVLRTYGAIPQESRFKTTIRLHRDHDRYDDSHIDLWKSNYPEVQIDSGLSPIRKLLKSSELVICTTLGTTEIECFYRNIPVVMSLDPQLHRPRPEFEPLLQELEQVGIVHFSDESLRRFFEKEFEHLLEWWTSEKVRSVVSRYLDRYAYSSRTPFRDYRRLLRQAASEKK